VESAICQIARESNDFEFRCEDGEKLRVTFTLDCCDHEAISWVASPNGYRSVLEAGSCLSGSPLLHFKVCYGINGVFTHSGAPQGKDKRPFKFLHTSVPTEYDQPKPKYRPVLIG